MALPSIAPYAHLHTDEHGPGDSRPSALKIIEDQGLAGKWIDKTILITGCSSGIGVETARALYATGAKIFITARNVQKGKEVAKDLSTGHGQIEVIEMSLDSLDSIRSGVAAFLERSKQLNVLINNAGVMATPEGRTEDGFETQFGTNHLGHFYLFQLLKPTLMSSALPGFASRVISLSSTGHRGMQSIQWDDLDFNIQGYVDFKAYYQSKLANVYFANELDRLYGQKGIRGLSVHPGSIETDLQRHIQDHPLLAQVLQDKGYTNHRKNQQQGAATTVWAAVAKELENKGGLYLDDVQVADPAEPNAKQYAHGYAPQAYNPEAEARLWQLSNRMVRLQE